MQLQHARMRPAQCHAAPRPGCSAPLSVLSASRGRSLGRRHAARVATSPSGRRDKLTPEQPGPTSQEQQPAAEQDAGFEPITAIWARNAAAFPDAVALEEPHCSPPISVTYSQLNQAILDFAAGLKARGLQAGERVCLFAESSCRWIVADQAVLMNGAADAVRGSSSPPEELAFITRHCNASALVLQDAATAAKLLPVLLEQHAVTPLKFVALLWRSHPTTAAAAAAVPAEQQAAALDALAAAGVPVLQFEEVVAAGQALRAVGSFAPAPVARSSLATLVYTSGTTGNPKGVMLSHGNLAYQVANLSHFLPVSPGESTLTLLPPWHIYQRTVAYYLASRGAREVFSNLRCFRDDLTAHPPDHFVCVPLVLDTLYNKVMAKLRSDARGIKGAIVAALLSAANAYVAARRLLAGTDLRYALAPAPGGVRLRAALAAALLAPVYALAQRLVFSKVRAALGIRRTVVSGGGSLAAHLDAFYEAVGLPVLNGWGLTETSPVLACRRWCDNVRGTVGLPTPGTQLVVVDPVTHAPLPDGQQGLLLAAGPGVMKGYLHDEAASRAAFVDGWLDTGDLGWRAPDGVPGSTMAGHIVLTGRAKDTLVLLSGKNIEPQPIEDALQRSPLIKHVVLVGQDKRELGALVFPDEEALADAANSVTDAAQLESRLASEVAAANSARPDYHAEDHIAHIQVIRSPLSVESGTLTRTMKPRRPQIMAAYAPQVAALLARLRG